MFKKGQRVVKLIRGGGTETASITKVVAVDKKRGLCSTDDSHVFKASDIEPDGVQTYRTIDGTAMANYIPGFSTRIVILEE